jgi:adenylosuccinate lyase
VKDLTRGAKIDAASLSAFVNTLPLPAAERARLAALRPAQYLGLAAELTLNLPGD